MNTVTIDVCGLACPEPLIAFTKAAKDASIGDIEISFDCGAARDNISRAALSSGWTIDSIVEESDHTVMKLSRKPA